MDALAEYDTQTAAASEESSAQQQVAVERTTLPRRHTMMNDGGARKSMAASRKSMMPAAQDSRKSMFAFEEPSNSLSLTATIDLLEVRLCVSASRVVLGCRVKACCATFRFLAALIPSAGSGLASLALADVQNLVC